MKEWLNVFTDEEVLHIIGLSLRVSVTALVIGATIGIIAGITLGIYDFKGKKIILSIVYTCMGIPPVLVGVIVYLLLSRDGILGPLSLLFTPTAMIIAQTVLVTPIVIGLTFSDVSTNAEKYKNSALTLGANSLQLWGIMFRESKRGIITACLSAFGRAISEVGAVMLVGGNIQGYTRVMTTAIILETRQGNFSIGLALGAVLLLISFLINFFVLWRFMFKRMAVNEVVL